MPLYKLNGKKDGLQRYRVRVAYTIDGVTKELTKTVYGREEAKAEEHKLMQLAKEKTGITPVKITIKELSEEYITSKKSEVRASTLDKTDRILRRYVLSQLADKRIDKLSVRILQQWKIYIDSLGLSHVTKQNIYGEFRTMLNYAVRLEYIPFNPLLKIGNFRSTLALKKEMDFYTVEEFKQFISVAKECAIDYEKKYNSLYEWNFYVFFNIAYFTGARKGEIYGLRWSSIKGDRLSITCSVNQKVHSDKNQDLETAPKNRSSIRTIQIPVPLLNILNEHKERKKLLNGFSEDSRIIDVRDSNLSNRNQTYAEKAGIKKIRIHDFRHSHVSLLAHKNINIQEIAKRLGHADIEQTLNTYSHLYPQEEENAIRVLNAI